MHSPTDKPVVTLDELARRFGGEVAGDGRVQLAGINSLESARGDEVSFLSSHKYLKLLETTRAGAIIVEPADQHATSVPRLVIANPYLCFARVAAFFHPPVKPLPGIHPSAVVEPGARIAVSASIGPFAYIAEGAVVGERCVVGSHASIGGDVSLGEDTRLYPRVVLYPGCRIGQRVILHAGVVVGADGFGLAKDGSRWIKIPQIGRAIIGDDVEVGANTTIDRGALDDTVIGEGVKLDNQIQVGHNVKIGAHTAIAGCVGISGSATIGRHCTIGGGVGIVGHLEICDNVHISGFTLISKSITKPGQYTSQLPQMTHAEWLKTASHWRHLDALADKIKDLRLRMDQLTKEKS